MNLNEGQKKCCREKSFQEEETRTERVGVSSKAEIQQKTNLAAPLLCSRRQITNLKMVATQLRSEGSDKTRLLLVKKALQECQDISIKVSVEKAVQYEPKSLIPDQLVKLTRIPLFLVHLWFSDGHSLLPDLFCHLMCLRFLSWISKMCLQVIHLGYG